MRRNWADKPMHPVAPGRAGAQMRPVPDAFLADLLADWAEHGNATIERVRQWTPHRYFQLIAALAPRAPAPVADEYDGMSEEEVIRELVRLIALLEADGVDLGRGPAGRGGANPAPPADRPAPTGETW